MPPEHMENMVEHDFTQNSKLAPEMSSVVLEHVCSYFLAFRNSQHKEKSQFILVS